MCVLSTPSNTVPESHCPCNPYLATSTIPTLQEATQTRMVETSPAHEWSWTELTAWWLALAARLGVGERAGSFFARTSIPAGALTRAVQLGANPQYLLFVLLRFWIPPVLPPPGRERMAKQDQDYWLETEQVLKMAVARLRELKPLMDLLTTSNPFANPDTSSAPVVEVELATMLESIAGIAGSYGGPDYTSVIKNFDPVPLRQTQPFKHNKKNSAELWVVFLLREHFRGLSIGKDRYWPLVADLIAEADLLRQDGQPYGSDELKSWWQKNWPRTYTHLEQKTQGPEPTGAAYQQDFAWFQAWWEWQRTRSPA